MEWPIRCGEKKILTYFILLSLLNAVAWANNPAQEQIQMIERSMNANMDPCEDFYTYACANWQANYATEDYSEMTAMVAGKLSSKLEEYLKERVGSRRNAHSAYQKMKIYYKACNKNYDEDAMNYFKHIKPGVGLEWPILQSHANGDAVTEWPAENFDLYKLLGELHACDVNHLLVSVVPYRAADGTLQIHFNLPEAPAEADSEEEVELLAKLGFTATISSQYGNAYRKMDTHWRETYAQYAENETVESMIYSELKTSYANLWKIIEFTFPGKIDAQDEIFINNVDYYRFFNDYSVPQGPEALQLANYLMLKFLKYLKDDSHSDCVEDTRRKMDLAANFWYSSFYYNATAQQKNAMVQGFIEKIHRQLSQLLDENFMHLRPSQIAKLKQKVSALKVNTGNLPANINKSYVDDYFADVQGLSSHDYHHNHLILLRHRMLERLSSYQNQSYIKQYVDTTSYDIDSNLFIIPLTYLEAPIYDDSYDDVLRCLERDLVGYETSLYADIKNHAKFNQFLECLKAQNDNENVDERFADAVGIRLAYRAYVSDKDPHDTQGAAAYTTTIPQDKLFFMNMAQYYCGNDDSDKANLQQMVMNSEDFAKAFQCRLDTPMNPREKCRLY
uniref:Peptidase M13 N-terminal domain-containing protein n=1 Tax=Stomoxys calcitrans TaxID=35570 RepID=A0A1I8P523_STOCA